MPLEFSSVIDPLIDCVNTVDEDGVIAVRSIPQWLDSRHPVLTIDEAKGRVRESNRVWNEDLLVDLELIVDHLLRTTPGLPRDFVTRWKTTPFELPSCTGGSGSLYRSLMAPFQGPVLRAMGDARTTSTPTECLFSEEEIRRHKQWLASGNVEGSTAQYDGIHFDHYLVLQDPGVGMFSRRKTRQSIERKLARKLYDLNLRFIDEAIEYYSSVIPNTAAQTFLRNIRRRFVRSGKLTYPQGHQELYDLQNLARPYFDISRRNPRKDIEDPSLASLMNHPVFLQAVKGYVADYYALKDQGESFRLLGRRIPSSDFPRIELERDGKTEIFQPRDIYPHEFVRDWDYVMPDVMGIFLVMPSKELVEAASGNVAKSGDFAFQQRFEDHYHRPDSNLRAIQHHVQLEGAAATVHSCELVIMSVFDLPFYYAGPYAHSLRRNEQERIIEKSGARELWNHLWRLEGSI